MNYYLDDDSQKILQDAKRLMFELRHPYVGSEHLFLSILYNDNLDITKCLNNYGINYNSFKNELVKIIGIGKKNNKWFLFTPLLRKIIEDAYLYSENRKVVTPKCLLVSLLQIGDCVCNRLLLGMNVDLDALYDKFSDDIAFYGNDSTLLLNEYAVNMNKKCMNGDYDPVICRDNEINQIIRILLRKKKNNPLLIGNAGVGKTSLIEELVRRIVNYNVPRKLKDMVIYNLPISVLVAGTRYRGDFEEKIHKVIEEVKNNPNIILFIDEVHTIMGAGGADGAIDCSNILKPYLSRGDVKIIGATTVDEYRSYIEKDKALERRFQIVNVFEPGNTELLKILNKIKINYEEYHNIKISSIILKRIIDLSNMFMKDRYQPDKSIDLLDELCCFVNMNHYSNFNKYEKKIREIEIKKNNMIIGGNFKKALLLRKKEDFYKSIYIDEISNTNNNVVKVRISDLYDFFYQKTNIPLGMIFKNKFYTIRDQLIQDFSKYKMGICDLFNSIICSNYLNNNKSFSALLVSKSVDIFLLLLDKVAEVLLLKDNYYIVDLKKYNDKYSCDKIIDPLIIYNNTESYIFNNIKYNPFSIILFTNTNECSKRMLMFIQESLNNNCFKVSDKERIDISKCLVFFSYTSDESNIGFISSNKNTNIFFDTISRLVNKTVYF